MMRQLSLNQTKTGRSVLSLLVMLMALLSAQSVWAQNVTSVVTFTGYSDGVITGTINDTDDCNWTASDANYVGYANGSLSVSPYTDGDEFKVTSVNTFYGTLNAIEIPMDEKTNLTIRVYLIGATGAPVAVDGTEVSYEEDRYEVIFTEEINLEGRQIQIGFVPDQSQANNDFANWTGINLVGQNVVKYVGYDLYVMDTQVTSVNAHSIVTLEAGTVSFDASTNTLTLDNASMAGDIRSGLDNLTIKVIGNNSIESSENSPIYYQGNGTGTLEFVKDEEVEDVSKLYLSCTNYDIDQSAIAGFSSVSYGEGMSLSAAYGTEYSTTGHYYHNTLVSSYVALVSEVTITSATVYPLWYDQVQVTSENAEYLDTYEGDTTVSFDSTTSTLTFDHLSGGYGFHAVVTDMELLNVYLIGSNSMGGEGESFFYTPTEGNKINFQTSENEPGSLNMSAMSPPFEGFIEADITFENGLKYTLTPTHSEEDPTEIESYTADIQVPPYGLVVYTTDEPNGVQVTKSNRANVLGEDEPTVMFDGHNRLVLSGANLTKISLTDPNFLPIVDNLNKQVGMEIYLEGDNTITSSDAYAIQSEGAAAATLLDFLTGGDAPGSLTCTSTSADFNPFSGFQVTCKNNLVYTAPFGSEPVTATVNVPLDLIVNNIGIPAQITFDESHYDVGLDNDIIDKVLYTLADNHTAESPDGFVSALMQIVINSTMTDAQVEATDNLVPGSAAYAAAFKGLTFIVPAGTGVITLKNVVTAVTAGDFAFHVRVGQQEPVEVTNDSGTPQNIEVPFTCSSASYVKIYLVSTGAHAPQMASHRIGPKSSVSGGLGGMSVSSSMISAGPAPAAPYLMMAVGDYSKTGSSITVNNADVTDLPENAFGFSGSGAPAMSPRRAAGDYVSFINASSTKITGKHFTREDGAFKGAPEETLIYLPAGNTAEGKNFIIGGVCDDLQLKADLDEGKDFELSATSFTAAKADFTRSFTKGGTDPEFYTVFLPYDMKVDESIGQFFTYDSYDTSTETVSMSKVAVVGGKVALTANTAYIYSPAATGKLPVANSVEVKKPATESAPAASSESEGLGLHGVYKYHKWTTAPDNIYCYSAADSGGDGIKAGEFAKVGAGTFVRPFRAYLRIPATTAPEYLAINWGDGTTSVVPIDKTQVQQDADGWYTITGFRLPGKPTEKGIYIHQGKKVIK